MDGLAISSTETLKNVNILFWASFLGEKLVKGLQKNPEEMASGKGKSMNDGIEGETLFQSGFLNLGITDILDHITVLSSCPAHCRMFGGIPGLCPLDGSSIPLVMTKLSDFAKCPLGQISPRHPTFLEPLG